LVVPFLQVPWALYPQSFTPSMPRRLINLFFSTNPPPPQECFIEDSAGRPPPEPFPGYGPLFPGFLVESSKSYLPPRSLLIQDLALPTKLSAFRFRPSFSRPVGFCVVFSIFLSFLGESLPRSTRSFLTFFSDSPRPAWVFASFPIFPRFPPFFFCFPSIFRNARRPTSSTWYAPLERGGRTGVYFPPSLPSFCLFLVGTLVSRLLHRWSRSLSNFPPAVKGKSLSSPFLSFPRLFLLIAGLFFFF